MTQRNRIALTLLLALVFLPLTAWSWDREPVQTFATLPGGEANPEGITADDAGNIYVTTFAVSKPEGAFGQLFVFRPNGKLLRQVQVSIEPPSALLLGLEFHPDSKKLLVADLGGQRVLTVDPVNGDSVVFASIPVVVDGVTSAGPNALTFDKDGNVYISDSFQGIIWRTSPDGGTPEIWVKDELLRTAGFPPFGANGLAFNKNESILFVANTGNDTVVQIPVLENGDAGMPAVFVQSINGADGLIIDDEDNLWVAANQADEIVVVDPTGRAIAKLGDFDGINMKGEPIGLLFPASLVRSGKFVYVTNLSLNLGQAVDSPWTAQVVRHTISRLPARIPPVQGFILTGQ
jgi:sugar lactone lactonase YvrE